MIHTSSRQHHLHTTEILKHNSTDQQWQLSTTCFQELKDTDWLYSFYGSCDLIQIKMRWETERYFTFSDPARMYFSNWLVRPVHMDHRKERHVACSGTKFMTIMNRNLYVVTGTQLQVCYAICWRFSIILLFLKTRHSSFHKFLYNLVVGYLCLGVLHFFVYRRKGDYVFTCVCLFVC